MSTQALQYIPDHYVTMFDSSWQLLLQQLESRLKERIKVVSEKGSAIRFNQVAPYSAMSQVTARGAVTPVTNIAMPTRWVYPAPFQVASLIDEFDEHFLAMVSNPSSEVIRSQLAAYNRAADSAIIQNLLGSATITDTASSDTTGFTMNNTTKTVAFDTANQLVPVDRVPLGGTAANSGMTIDKIRYAKFKLDHAEAPSEDRFLVISAAEVQDLLTTTEVTNQLYNSVRALVDGEVDSFLGFKIIRSELLPIVSATTSAAGAALTGGSFRQCVAYQKNAAVFVEGGRKAFMDVRADLSHALQIRSTAILGCGRLLDNGVVQIVTDTSKQ